MIESEIRFKLNGKDQLFLVTHNLPDFGLDIEAAFINWSARAKKHSISSFCQYVKSKDKGIICDQSKPKLYACDCPKWGNSLSSTVGHCPECGEPLKVKP